MATTVFGGLQFTWVGNIEPVRDATGRVLTFMPQAQFNNIDNYGLHQYGRGPFCKFTVSTSLGQGVYVFAYGDKARYIGECVDLASRLNNGYGNISPRNCFDGGQPTNCRVNSLVLMSVQQGERLTLWFHPTTERKEVEARLIRLLMPPWNVKGTNGAAETQRSNSSYSPPSLGAHGVSVEIQAPAYMPAVRRPNVIRNHSSAMNPTSLVWEIADQMTASHPAVTRAAIIDECLRRGVTRNTANTQYSAWKRAKTARRSG